MTDIIKKMQEILGNDDSSLIRITIFPTDIYFEIYESEIPIVINKKNRQVYVDCEVCNNQLTSDMLDELSGICKVLEENIDTLLQFVN